MECPVCDEELIQTETDSRQEWTRESYSCDNCKNDFTLLTTFKTQSSLIHSQEWEQPIETMQEIYEEEKEKA